MNVRKKASPPSSASLVSQNSGSEPALPWTKLFLLTALTLVSAGLGQTAAAAAQLKLGRYVGWLEIDGVTRKFGVIFDTYAVQPNDLTEFPRQNAVLKVGLGGLVSHEYQGQVYENIRYDFGNGVLSLDSPDNDVVLTGTVINSPSTAIDGDVFVRSAGVSGKIHLDFQESDEPGEPGGGSGGTLPPDQYVPELTGQYRGQCDGGGRALVQIETGRGLGAGSDGERHGLYSYSIQGRLGTQDDLVCGSGRWCAKRNYENGSYDFFLKRLLLETSNGSDECDVTDTGLDCRVHLTIDAVDHCVLRRDPLPVAPAAFATRSFSLKTTAAQRAKLPDPNPPGNLELITALRGNFIGNLHHEATDRYQVLRLNVSASSSTNNPHNENLVYVTTSAMLHFGPGTQLSRDFWPQSFEPRSFYLAPGFTLESANSDAFLQIQEWDAGYVRGVWFSHQFGRVGTFELVKGSALPEVSAVARFVPPAAGEFIGPRGASNWDENAWWFSLLMPIQQPRVDDATASLKGEYQLTSGIIPRRAIEKGSYDFYTGALAWITSQGNIITGTVKDERTLNLFWSGVPLWGILMDLDHNQYPYGRR